MEMCRNTYSYMLINFSRKHFVAGKFIRLWLKGVKDV